MIHDFHLSAKKYTMLSLQSSAILLLHIRGTSLSVEENAMSHQKAETIYWGLPSRSINITMIKIPNTIYLEFRYQNFPISGGNVNDFIFRVLLISPAFSRAPCLEVIQVSWNWDKWVAQQNENVFLRSDLEYLGTLGVKLAFLMTPVILKAVLNLLLSSHIILTTTINQSCQGVHMVHIHGNATATPSVFLAGGVAKIMTNSWNAFMADRNLSPVKFCSALRGLDLLATVYSILFGWLIDFELLASAICGNGTGASGVNHEVL